MRQQYHVYTVEKIMSICIMSLAAHEIRSFYLIIFLTICRLYTTRANNCGYSSIDGGELGAVDSINRPPLITPKKLMMSSRKYLKAKLEINGVTLKSKFFEK